MDTSVHTAHTERKKVMEEHKQTEERMLLDLSKITSKMKKTFFFKRGKTTQGLGSKPLI